MKPRFCVSPLGVSDAVNSAWRTYSRLYDTPDQTVRPALEACIHRLVIHGERNQDQLTVKALIYLQKRESKTGSTKSGKPRRATSLK
jgi:hypothetical protein